MGSINIHYGGVTESVELESVGKENDIDAIKLAIEEYLKEHPVTSGATEEERLQIDSNTIEIDSMKDKLNSNNAGSHNSIFRGKLLGTSVSDEQYSSISNGTFEDLYIGDYWIINDITYRIAGFDIFLNIGDTQLTKHHTVIVPDKNMYSAQMNETNDTTGGYWNSAMKQTNLAQALTTVKSAFGDSHIVTRRALLTNAMSGGNASGWSWYDTQIDIMTECQVYGFPAWGQTTHNGYGVACEYSRLPLFTLAPEFVTNRSWYWLRDVCSLTNFCIVYSYGSADRASAFNSAGVRPQFCIG